MGGGAGWDARMKVHEGWGAGIATCIMGLCYMNNGPLKRSTNSYLHQYLSAYLHTSIHTHTRMYIHTHIHSYIYTYTHAYVHTFILTQKYTHKTMITYLRTYKHTYTHENIHTYMHTYINTHVRTFMNTYMYTYKWTCIHISRHALEYIERRLSIRVRHVRRKHSCEWPCIHDTCQTLRTKVKVERSKWKGQSAQVKVQRLIQKVTQADSKG